MQTIFKGLCLHSLEEDLYEILVECADEPIRTPDAIQRFGSMLIVDDAGTLLHVSYDLLERFDGKFADALENQCMNISKG